MASRPSDSAVNAELKRLRRARHERYKADGVKRVRWIAVRDGRTCDQCAALHGQMIDINDKRWPQLLALHAGCRCRFLQELDLPRSSKPNSRVYEIFRRLATKLVGRQ